MIKSFVKGDAKYLKEGITKAGYKSVSLCKDKKKTSKNVHRLIARSFFGESEMDVNHKDGNKLNNKIENLEYVTKSQNIRHALKNGLFKPNYKKIAEDTRKQIAQINIKTNEVVNIYVSAHEASRQTKINRGNISSTCRGICGNAGGYKWKYL